MSILDRVRDPISGITGSLPAPTNPASLAVGFPIRLFDDFVPMPGDESGNAGQSIPWRLLILVAGVLAAVVVLDD